MIIGAFRTPHVVFASDYGLTAIKCKASILDGPDAWKHGSGSSNVMLGLGMLGNEVGRCHVL